MHSQSTHEEEGTFLLRGRRPVPVNVYRGVATALIWKLIVVQLWVYFGMYRSPYYRVGPSVDLYLAFVNVPIDNMWIYSWLMAYIIVQCMVQVYSGDNVYPWINAVVINPGVPLEHNKREAYVLTNLYWSVNCFNSIFFFALGFSQVDFALAIAVSSAAAGMFTSYFIVFDSSRQEPAELAEITTQ